MLHAGHILTLKAIQAVLLALVLSGCSTIISTERKSMSVNKHRTSAWAARTQPVLVYRSDGSVVKVKTEAATYEAAASDKAGTMDRITVIAFTEPLSKKTWIGPEWDFYIATDSEILGGVLGPILQFHRSVVNQVKAPNVKDAIGRAIAQFEEEDNWNLILFGDLADVSRPFAGIREIGDDFFGETPGSAQEGALKLTGAQLKGKELRLDLKNPSGISTASVWIDLSANKLLKAVRDGKQVFPR